MRRPAKAIGWSLSLVAVLAAGCIQQPDQTEKQLRQCQQENLKLKAKNQNLQQTLLTQERQIQTLQGLGEKRLDLLFHVADIKLGRYTAGVNLDGEDGDDGIRVYLRPIDRDGHAIKAAGSVKIQLFDLADKPAESLLADYEFPVEKIAACWTGGFMTYHYRFDCRWKQPPKHDEITVRVTFTDYLTGKVFTAQKVCKVRLSVSTTQPVKQPAVDLEEVSKLLTDKVGGKWEKDIHNALPGPILRGRIYSAPDKVLVRYNVFPFGAADRDKQRRLLKVYRSAKGVRIIGANAQYTVLELTFDLVTASKYSRMVISAMKLLPLPKAETPAKPKAG